MATGTVKTRSKVAPEPKLDSLCVSSACKRTAPTSAPIKLVDDIAEQAVEAAVGSLPAKSLVSAYLGSVVRTGLAAAGGGLIAKGIITPIAVDGVSNAITDIAIGAGSYLFAQVWSIFNKKK